MTDSLAAPANPGSDDNGGPITAALAPLPGLIFDDRSSGAFAAVRCGADCLTWSQLDQQSLTIARHLVGRGVRHGDPVAGVLPRATSTVAAMLGVMRMGAVWVPVDASYPHARQQAILNVAAASFTLTSETVDAILAPSQSNQAPHPEIVGPGLDDTAYLMFTSGSTGKPRGVRVLHRQLAASTLARFDAYRTLHPHPKRFLMVSSFGFDSSVAGTFWTLAAGGELVIPTDDEVHDFDALARLIDDHDVTHTLMVPTVWDALLQRSADKLTSIQTAIVAGETCRPRLARRHADVCPGSHLVNEYGPTEATVWSSMHHVQPTDQPVPIGRAIPGTTLRVANERGYAQPMGVEGELWISGEGLSEGYVNDEQQTGERFVILADGTRWYRSGDRVRRTSDGSLVFLGRMDGQLSVGGVRVEPEEIESVITALPGIAAAGAVVVSDRRDQLVAFVEPTATVTDFAELSEQVRSACTAQLPVTIRPQRILVKSHLPRTPHGKIDRPALAQVPVPDSHALTTVPSQSPPTPGANHTPTVSDITQVWQQALGSTTVSEQTDFFEAGGDSLAAFELCLAVEDRFGISVPISALIESPTPASFAAEIARLGRDQQARTVEPPNASQPARPLLFEHIRPGDRRPPLVLLAPGGGHLLGYAPMIEALDKDQSVVGFRLPGADGKEEPCTSIDAQADRLMDEVVNLARSDGRPLRLFGLSTGGLLGLELAHRLGAMGLTPGLVALGDTIYPGFQEYGRLALSERLRTVHGDDGPRAAVDYLAGRVRMRADTIRASAQNRRFRNTGQGFSPKAHEAYLYGLAGDMALRYEVPSYNGRVLLFSASETDIARTVQPWSKKLPHIEVFTVAGVHDAIVEDPLFAKPLARELQATLDRAST